MAFKRDWPEGHLDPVVQPSDYGGEEKYPVENLKDILHRILTKGLLYKLRKIVVSKARVCFTRAGFLAWIKPDELNDVAKQFHFVFSPAEKARLGEIRTHLLIECGGKKAKRI